MQVKFFSRKEDFLRLDYILCSLRSFAAKMVLNAFKFVPIRVRSWLKMVLNYIEMK